MLNFSPDVHLDSDNTFTINNFTFSINAPSYKRPKVETLDYLPYARIWVAEKEFPDYQAVNGSEAVIISVPDEVQGNVARIRNYILDEEFKRGLDGVVILDDDMNAICYWENKTAIKVKPEELPLIIYKYSILCRDLGSKLWGFNINQDKQVYREYTPFSTTSFLGAPFGCFIDNAGGIRYDEELPLKEDYDMTLAQLEQYRKILRVNKFYYQVKQSAQAGGCAMIRNYAKEEQQFNALQSKWGADIVKQDKANRSHNLKQTKHAKRKDYNPIIKVPIKGV